MRLSLIAVSIGLATIAQFSLAADGVYTGQAMGRNGEVAVDVTIQDGKIKGIDIKSWSETHPVADYPKVEIPKEIIDYQTTNVNNVTGASFTSLGIAAAVKDALIKAGLDPKNFIKKAPAPVLQTGVVVEETGLVVVGGGGAGLSAAVTAAQNGVPVVLVEKTHYAGGNTSVAGGCFNAADPDTEKGVPMNPERRQIVDNLLAEPVQNELHGKLIDKVKQQLVAYDQSGSTSLFDSPELHALQTWKAGDYKGNLELVYRLTREAPVMKKELSDMGLVWKDTSTQGVGALWPRSNTAKNYKSGVGFIDTFLDLIKTKGLPITFLYNTRAKDLILQDGRVVGVKAKGDNGLDYEIYGRDGVVLATGGFGGNVEMRQQYDEIWDKKLDKTVMTTNLPQIQGDGIKMAEKAGANLVQMGYIQLLPITDPATGLTTFYFTSPTAMYVNQDGKRFVNELGRRDELSRAALAQPGKRFYALGTKDTVQLDEQGRNHHEVKLDDILKQKKGFKGDTWEELAHEAGISQDNLLNSIAQFNEFCKTLKDPEFGRSGCDPDHRLDGQPPYYASTMGPSVHHTMGGVQINVDAQVIDKQGKVIPGLYAAGEVTGGIHGTNRVGCNAVPDALIYGRIAALTAIGKKPE